MTPDRRDRIEGLLGRLRMLSGKLRQIDIDETAQWLSGRRTKADAEAFDSIGDASHHFNRLIAALTKAKEAGQ